MPLYEYYCSACQTRFELMRSMSRAIEPADCPQCEAPSQRALSLFAAFTAGEADESTPIAGAGGCGACAGGACACAHGH